MESALQNVERGIRDALQRLSDARARLATHRAALDEGRLMLASAVSPLLQLYPAEPVSLIPSCSSRGAKGTLVQLLSGHSAKSVISANNSPRHNALHCVDNPAEDAEEAIIISPTTASSAAASVAAAAGGRVSAPPPLPSLQLPPLMPSVLALPRTSMCAGFYSAMVARMQQLEEQRFNYRSKHVMHAAKLQIAQTWAREVQPWFDTVVQRGFFQQVIRRLDALDRRVARLCGRLALDRPQYVLTHHCTIQLKKDGGAPDPMVGKEGHLRRRQPYPQWCLDLTGDELSRGQSDLLCGANEQVLSGSDGGGERQAVQRCCFTEEVTCLSGPPSQQGRPCGATVGFGSAEGNHPSMCSLWRQYVQMASQTPGLGDEQRQTCEQSYSTPLPAEVLPEPLLRTPRSLRHVWHVIMEGLTSSGVDVVNNSVSAEPPHVLFASDGVYVGDAMRKSGNQLCQSDPSGVFLQNLSDLVRRCSALHPPPSAAQSTLPLCSHAEHRHETEYHGGRNDFAGDGRCGATALTQAPLPQDTDSPTVGLLSSHVCVLLCCAMQLCALAKLCNGICAGKPVRYKTPLPQLAYDGDVGGCSEDDAIEDGGIGDVEVARRGPRRSITVLAGTTDGLSMCQHTCEEQIAEALAAVYHAVPCLLSQFGLVFQKRNSSHEDDSDGWQGRRSEVKAAEVDESTGPQLCVASAGEGRICLMSNSADAGAAADGATDAVLWPTVGDALRDRDTFVQWWLSLASLSFNTELPQSGTPLVDLSLVYARALRVGCLFHSLLDSVEDACGERLPLPAAEAVPAVPSPGTPTLLTVARADSSTLAIRGTHVAHLNTIAAHRAAANVSASVPPLAASAQLSSLRQIELQMRQEWQSIETRLSVARSMAAATLRQAAHNDNEAGDLAC
ncbi:hypothetical protein LPMP_262010 [Leishmania panamensis]|uniref:Uncharacterized protein n=1 Tax=Leishmania panamensis TaxID=5679 RepID=A0A088RTI6_LEIPA|nr:hypothetical protein LPMP_262010 [Leishmania panamensis]AIN99313.1 hypothetical protein LPMP_262010 [Leishmania panamensis]